MTRLVDLLRSSHPGPTATVTAISVVLAVAIRLDALHLVIVGIAVLANQLSIGLSNDALDVERDRAAARRDKPVASGALSARVALGTAIGLATLSLVLSAVAGLGVLGANSVLLAAGWTYNAALKRRPASVLPYLLGFAALPWIVTLALHPPRPAALTATAAAALLGGAAHFANVLPDLADDRAAGVRGLPQRLGLRGSVICCCAALVGAAVCLGIAAAHSRWALVAVAVTVVAAIVATAIGLTGRNGRRVFQLVMIAALADVVALALSGTALLGPGSFGSG